MVSSYITISNIIAPYLLKDDYAPMRLTDGFSQELDAFHTDISDYNKPERTLEVYKNNYFIINALRTKTYVLEGQTLRLSELVQEAEALYLTINEYIKEAD